MEASKPTNYQVEQHEVNKHVKYSIAQKMKQLEVSCIDFHMFVKIGRCIAWALGSCLLL